MFFADLEKIIQKNDLNTKEFLVNIKMSPLADLFCSEYAKIAI